eukprot:COSAG05_NODE_18951_length_300_cov_0.776119_1_plen_44_part_01
MQLKGGNTARKKTDLKSWECAAEKDLNRKGWPTICASAQDADAD